MNGRAYIYTRRPRSGQRLWYHLTGRKNELGRLDWEIARLHQRLLWRQNILTGKPHAANNGASSALTQAQSALTQAREAREGWDAGGGWALLGQAQEFEVMSMGKPEVEATRTSLTSEVTRDGYAGWWREGALDLLKQVSVSTSRQSRARQRRHSGPGAAPKTPKSSVPKKIPVRHVSVEQDREFLRQALRTRNEWLSKQSLAFEFNSKQRIWLSSILAALLVVAGSVIVNYPDVQANNIDIPEAAGAAAVAGAIGAVTSAMQRLCNPRRSEIPERFGSFTIVLIQTMTGVVAALTTYLAVAGELINLPGNHDVRLLVLAAFGAGFTERLVVYRAKKAS